MPAPILLPFLSRPFTRLAAIAIRSSYPYVMIHWQMLSLFTAYLSVGKAQSWHVIHVKLRFGESASRALNQAPITG